MKRLFNHEPYKYDDDTLKQVHRGVLGAIIGDIAIVIIWAALLIAGLC